LPFSQSSTEVSLTSINAATSICLRPRSFRTRRRCAASVSPSSAISSGFTAFSVICRNGKRATRPCRCGHLSDPALACSRAPKCAADYQARVSGPLLDRIDLHVEVAAVTAADLVLPPPSEGTAEVAARVASARALQTGRRAQADGARTNAELEGTALEAVAGPDEAGRTLLAEAAAAMKLSARGYTRVLRVARTIADLAGAETVGRIHVAEALGYRRRPPVN
jgi:magnesium chelatase family protein